MFEFSMTSPGRGLSGKDRLCLPSLARQGLMLWFYNPPRAALPFCPEILRVQSSLLFPMLFRVKERKAVSLLWYRVIAAIWHSHLSAWSFHYLPPICFCSFSSVCWSSPFLWDLLLLKLLHLPALYILTYLLGSLSPFIDFSYPAAKWAVCSSSTSIFCFATANSTVLQLKQCRFSLQTAKPAGFLFFLPSACVLIVLIQSGGCTTAGSY